MISDMAQQSSTIELAKDADKITEQLNRILSSKAFRQADRLKRFLSFIVEETVAGRGERLKEFVVGVEVFGKPESFDPRNDPIVRVQARRLRAQLARYYRDEAPDSELTIELPKGGYAPVFRQVRTLKSAGLNAEWREFPKGHTIHGAEEISVLREFVRAGYPVVGG